MTCNHKYRKNRLDICAAIEEMRNESELEGGIKGAVETCKKFNIPLQETIRHITENFGFSVRQAEEEVKNTGNNKAKTALSLYKADGLEV